jgi:hypothetical protein
LSRSPIFRSLDSPVIKPSNTAKLVAALALALGLQCGVLACDLAQEVAAEPEAAARAWVLTHVRSGEYLAGEDASARLLMASTTERAPADRRGHTGGARIPRDAHARGPWGSSAPRPAEPDALRAPLLVA